MGCTSGCFNNWILCVMPHQCYQTIFFVVQDSLPFIFLTSRFRLVNGELLPHLLVNSSLRSMGFPPRCPVSCITNFTRLGTVTCERGGVRHHGVRSSRSGWYWWCLLGSFTFIQAQGFGDFSLNHHLSMCFSQETQKWTILNILNGIVYANLG